MRRNADDLQRMEQALDALRHLVAAKEAIGHEQDILFHQSVIEAAHNPVPEKTMQGIGNLYHKSVKFSLKKNVGLYAKRQQVLKEHEAIKRAIEQQDATAARESMLTHLQNARTKIENKSKTSEMSSHFYTCYLKWIQGASAFSVGAWAPPMLFAWQHWMTV